MAICATLICDQYRWLGKIDYKLPSLPSFSQYLLTLLQCSPPHLTLPLPKATKILEVSFFPCFVLLWHYQVLVPTQESTMLVVHLLFNSFFFTMEIFHHCHPPFLLPPFFLQPLVMISIWTGYATTKIPIFSN
jgi:hypothetical protein